MDIVKRFYHQLIELNLFKDVNTVRNRNPRLIRDQIISTRVFLCLLFASITIISTYTSAETNLVTITVVSPSVETYFHLKATHSDTLMCLCQRIAVPYSSFLSTEPVFHQVSLIQ